MANSEISAATRLPKSTVSEHIELLCQMELVAKSAVLGGGSVYELRDGTGVGGALALFERNLLTIAAERFVDLWEF